MLCKSEGYIPINNPNECRNAFIAYGNIGLLAKYPDWVIRNNDKILPGCVYVPGYYLTWNQRNKNHPELNLEEWCQQTKECQKTQQVCISNGKFDLLC